MGNFFTQLFELITTAPGNLIYHLTLSVSILAAIQAILIGKRSSNYRYSRRMLLGFGLLLLGQIVLFISSSLVWQGVSNPHTFLPPLDRAVLTFSLIWLVWLWVTPEPSRLFDGLTGLLNLCIVLLFFFSLASWSGSDPTSTFNRTWLDWLWGALSLAILLAGILLLSTLRPDGWGIGLGILLVLLIGYAAHLLWSSTAENFAAAVRLAQLCTFPLLPTLAQRLGAAAARPAPAQTPARRSVPEEPNPNQRYSADPRAFHAWLQLAALSEPEKVKDALARAIAQTMLADMCLVVSAPNRNGEMIVQAGYDLVREENLPGGIIDTDKAPTLANAIQRGRPLRLSSDNKASPDLIAVAHFLGLETAGNLLSVPIAGTRSPWGAILFLSPYSDRTWSTEEQAFLLTSTESMMQILMRVIPHPGFDSDPQILQEELEKAQKQLAEYQQEQKTLLDEMAQLREAAANQSNASEIEALLAVQQEAQDTIASLQAENEQLRQGQLGSSGKSSTTYNQVKQLEKEMRLSLQEVARLQNSLAAANIQILELQNVANQAVNVKEEREVVASIAQELRQPLSSILGYTDLLLAESAGILGALQRKFLERVKSSTERMRALLDDLVQVTSLQSGQIKLSPQSVHLGALIDQAISDTSAQLREKNITLRVELPEEMPSLIADHDAMQQIIVQLLQNAGAATPNDGTIFLSAHIQQQEQRPYVLLQFTDSGGGIPPEELQRVFSRRYRAENALIQGVGDTGVGLSIAKTLVEAHNGHIWVESEAGKGATFSIRLPIRHEERPSDEEDE